jgi:photosystem II stability/assembly factor-like uncharacterized protein
MNGTTVTSLTEDSNNHIFAGHFCGQAFKSLDAGNSWDSMIISTQIYIQVGSIVCDHQNNIYAGTCTNGIYFSSDSGKTWNRTNQPNGSIISLFTIDNTIIAGTGGQGFIISTDNGQNWVQTGVKTSTIQSLAITQDGNLIAGTAPTPHYYNTGIFLYDQQSEHWKVIGHYPKVNALAVDSANNIYAITQATIGTHPDNVIKLSYNYENHWKGLLSFTDGIFSLAINEDNDLIAGITSELKSIKYNGHSWTTLLKSTGLIPKVILCRQQHIYLGTNQGVYISTDNGSSWNQAGLENKTIIALAVNSKATIFAGHYAITGSVGINGLSRSTDNGETWIDLALSGDYIFSISINSSDDIYVGTNSGVFKSIDDGASWIDINNELPPGSAYSITVDDYGYLYVALSNLGVYKSTVPTTEVIELSNEENLPNTYKLYGNYPNPFNATTIFKYYLPVQSDVILDIYNIMGQLVETLVGSNQSPGHYTINWNAENISSGVYFYRLYTGNFQQTRKCLILN